VRELCLIAEDTNQYGADLGADAPRLGALLDALEGMDGLRWVRLLYCFPSYFSQELVDAIARCKKVCRCIDVPLQHTSPSVLKRMRRPDREHTMKLLHRLQDTVEGLTFRSTFISGFPGETEEEHVQLLEDVSGGSGLCIIRGGGFPYSEEAGTSAADMDLAVPKERRLMRNAEVEQEFAVIRETWAEEAVGKEFDVMIDRMDGSEAVGRTEFDAPELDGEVKIPGALLPMQPGTMLKVRIVAADGTDLVGEVLGEA